MKEIPFLPNLIRTSTLSYLCGFSKWGVMREGRGKVEVEQKARLSKDKTGMVDSLILSLSGAYA